MYTIYDEFGNLLVTSNDNTKDINYIKEFYKKQFGESITVVEEFVPPLLSGMTLTQLKIEKIIQSKQQLAEFLENNPLLYNNEYYSVTQEKQSLLTSAIAAYQLKIQAGIPAVLKWNTTGDVCREFTLEEITGLVVAITEYVQPRVEKQQALEVQINNCTTVEELDGIVIDYRDIEVGE